MIPLKSSNIAGTDYDDATETLTVHFHNGTSYQYTGVSVVTFREFTLAESPGKFFHSNIRSAFPAAKLPKGS